MMRYYPGPDDQYGLTTKQLYDRLLLITGNRKAADDAMAAVAEWLDTARTHASPNASTEDLLQTLTHEAEAQVTDSAYGLIANANGERVRRRLLSRGDD